MPALHNKQIKLNLQAVPKTSMFDWLETDDHASFKNKAA
jgi:hypothetical protein